MDEEMLAGILRSMAWERAKGELRSIIQTYYDDKERFEGFGKALKDFIKLVEDNGYTE